MATNSLLYHDMPFPVFFNASAAKCPPRRPLKKMKHIHLHDFTYPAYKGSLFFYLKKGTQKLFHWAKKVCLTTNYCIKALFCRMLVHVIINAPWIHSLQRKGVANFCDTCSRHNNKSKMYQLWEPEMHKLSVISLYYTEMPTSGNLKSGDSLFGIYCMKSYMRYRPSQSALTTVMAK